jgi:hypothetical protein
LNPEIVRERIAVPEIPIKELATPDAMRPQIATGSELRRRHMIPCLHEFAVNFHAYVNKAADIGCPTDT